MTRHETKINKAHQYVTKNSVQKTTAPPPWASGVSARRQTASGRGNKQTGSKCEDRQGHFQQADGEQEERQQDKSLSQMGVWASWDFEPGGGSAMRLTASGVGTRRGSARWDFEQGEILNKVGFWTRWDFEQDEILNKIRVWARRFVTLGFAQESMTSRKHHCKDPEKSGVKHFSYNWLFYRECRSHWALVTPKVPALFCMESNFHRHSLRFPSCRFILERCGRIKSDHRLIVRQDKLHKRRSC